MGVEGFGALTCLWPTKLWLAPPGRPGRPSAFRRVAVRVKVATPAFPAAALKCSSKSKKNARPIADEDQFNHDVGDVAEDVEE